MTIAPVVQFIGAVAVGFLISKLFGLFLVAVVLRNENDVATFWGRVACALGFHRRYLTDNGQGGTDCICRDCDWNRKNCLNLWRLHP